MTGTTPGLEVPVPYRVVSRSTDIPETVTLGLDPIGPPISQPGPGQFTMLSAFAVGEVPISISGLPADDGSGLQQTIRSAGATTARLVALTVGDVVGVRGPFGTGWPQPVGDVVVVAGGLGVAPLLPTMRFVSARPQGRAALLVGARRPAELLAADELHGLGSERVSVHVTVDRADSTWHGDVGVVTELVPRIPFPLVGASALVCGPEVMMRHVARALLDRGIDPTRLFVSLERNMHCGHGSCGHCQLGPLFLCTDGPVVSWSEVAPILAVRSR